MSRLLDKLIKKAAPTVKETISKEITSSLKDYKPLIRALGIGLCLYLAKVPKPRVVNIAYNETIIILKGEKL